MSIVSAANFKSAIATAAADITTAWSDTVLDQIASKLSNNHHPLRNLKKLFILNPVDGVVTANDDYIDGAYAGGYPTVGSGFGKSATLAVSLTTGTVEEEAQTLIVLTFNTNITRFTNLSIAGTVTTPKVISSVGIAGAVVTITASTAYIFGDTISVTGDFYNGLDIVSLAAEGITNNVDA